MRRSEVMSRVSPAFVAGVLLALAPAVASADTQRTGGAAAPTRPVIAAAACTEGQPRCAPGEMLTVQGDGLGDTRVVTFLGRRGRDDDRRARPSVRADHLLTVRVPSRARSGVIRVTSQNAASAQAPVRLVIRGAPVSAGAADVAPNTLLAGGAPAVFTYRAPQSAAGQAAVEAFRVTDGVVVASWPVQPSAEGVGQVQWDGTAGGAAVPTGRYAFRVTGAAQTAVAADAQAPAAFGVLDAIFPIRGEHDLGQSATNAFGGPRGHKGQDMFADCGTPLVAARGGVVRFSGSESRAGNYVVITGADEQSYVYMHMRRPSSLIAGQRVLTGQPVGEVGETGRASGCHLHFELWSAPGWQEGTALDPLPELRRWDAFS